ncbi:MAG TPA: kelch repeat-containing protein, partial [bacterium]|nr:kelch repeat-containing protein [bacterium]
MRYTITIAAVLARVFFCVTLLPSFIFSQGGAWSSKTSMTTARWHSGIGVINNTLYVAGGYNGSHQTVVEAYNFTSNTWTTKNTRPVQTSAAYGVIGNTLYTAGGTNVSVRISDVWAYDPGL